MFFCNNLPAQELQAKFQDWNVFKASRVDQTVCYIASTPIKREGNFDKRGEPYFLVTNIINDADEVSVSSGFVYKKKSDVEISFGSKKYYLFPYLSVAWANDKADDIEIIKEMQRAEEFIVTAIARDGKIANDTYSLIGFAKAYKKMKETCDN
ncbi:MAG: invasion associated locus B family protein [Rickettsiales bacterium]|nr:invasion associated locus B family protein [Rickettsiales bacterium]